MPTTLRDPWLSVIMPTHHGEQWIDAALGSIAQHEAEGIEVLVLDSSSNGDTVAKVEAFADRLCIRVLDPGGRATCHTKTNLGVQEARSDHVCWLHQDDIWLPGRSAAVRRWIEAAPAAGLHLGNSRIIDRAGQSVGKWSCPLDQEGMVSSTLLLERLLIQNFIAVPVPVFRRDHYLQVGGLDETLWYTADWDLWLKLQAAGTVCFHPEVTAAFRIHESSQTVSGSHDARDFREQMEIVRDRHLPRLAQPNAPVHRASRAALEVNTALAAASLGNFSELRSAARALLCLNPSDWVRFLRDSRLFDRLVPRLRARLSGDF